MENKEKMNSGTMLNIIDVCYDKALSGLATSESVYVLANKYRSKYFNTKLAAQKMCEAQVVKCGTSGFITGLGGVMTLPVAVPANVSSVIYVQLRMIATLAVLAGLDPTDDQVRTLAYVCLTGSAAVDVLKKAGIKFGEKMLEKFIQKKISAELLKKINQKVGMRLFTKFGEKGIVNFGKLIPIAGGLIGGGFDVVDTKIIADVAYKLFMEGRME